MNNLAFLNTRFATNQATDAEISRQYSQLKTHYDSKNKIGWFMMNANPRPCFTIELLNNIRAYFDNVKTEMSDTNGEKYDFLVLASNVDGVFNLGGDLALFKKLIQQNDRDGLFVYAKSCVDVLYQNLIHVDLDVTTISVVQGDALGGGFEAALSSNILIAERGVKLGLPEVLFNLFPGMGAYTLLSRKVGPNLAEKIILSGKLYTAEYLYDLGIINILAERGDAELALYRYIKSANRSKNSYKAIRKVKDICNDVPYEELISIANIWVDCALKITPRDLHTMDRLVKRQLSKTADN